MSSGDKVPGIIGGAWWPPGGSVISSSGMSSSSGDCGDCALLGGDVRRGGELLKSWAARLSRLTVARTGGRSSVGTYLHCCVRYPGWDGSL